MKLSVGHIEARCLGCGGVEFQPPENAVWSRDSELVCEKCGRKNRYDELLNEIGEQAIKQANQSLARMRGRKDEQ